jgi:2-polyprenyl-3-methyl-5-hydroxy-6-metoxy-1,4-benzoquinol methylase
MFEFHKNKQHYFNIQYKVSKGYIIPFISPYLNLKRKLKVLEIGCAEAGILKAFLELGHQCTGIELSDSRIGFAKQFLNKEYKNGQVDFINKNIYNIDIETDLPYKYDLIILKDVIEHIPEQKRFISTLKEFLQPNGKIFFGFPPWQMPFGGHQQLCDHKIASILPWTHLLPKFLYKQLLKLFGEKKEKIKALIEIKNYGISIERFQRIIKKNKYEILVSKFYLINPIYQYKFNLKCREQFKFVNISAFARNFFTTSAFYLITPKK